MQQFEIDSNKVVLKVKKSYLFVRMILFVLAFVSFSVPISLWVRASDSGYVGITFIFGLIGIYLLRLALWNSFGKELITIEKNQVTYEVSYGWFKDRKETIKMDKLNYSIKSIGDDLGTLVLGEEKNRIETVVQMPIEQLQELVLHLERLK